MYILNVQYSLNQFGQWSVGRRRRRILVLLSGIVNLLEFTAAAAALVW